jgi:hypothetical protein
MAWKSLPAVTLTAANTPYPIDADPRIVHSIFMQEHWNNTGRLYIGDADDFDPTANPPTNLIGYLPPPMEDTTAPSFTVGEINAPNGVSTGDFWVAGSAPGDIVILSYYES